MTDAETASKAAANEQAERDKIAAEAAERLSIIRDAFLSGRDRQAVQMIQALDPSDYRVAPGAIDCPRCRASPGARCTEPAPPGDVHVGLAYYHCERVDAAYAPAPTRASDAILRVNAALYARDLQPQEPPPLPSADLADVTQLRQNVDELWKVVAAIGQIMHDEGSAQSIDPYVRDEAEAELRRLLNAAYQIRYGGGSRHR